MADLEEVRSRAKALIVEHLDPLVWSFGFDNAKTRAGLCNYTTKRITVSRYLATKYPDDEIHQVLLHEVAHALVGPRAGHGPRWKLMAEDIGYTGGRLHFGSVAEELAPWVGTCPAGHVYYRYKRPLRALGCGRCSRRYDAAHQIVWQARVVSAAARRRAASSN